MSLLHTDTGHQDAITSLAFSPDGQRLLSGSRDGTAKLWDAASGQLLRTIWWSSEQIDAVAWSPDGKSFAVGGWPANRTWNEADLAMYQASFADRRRPRLPLPEFSHGPDARTSELRIFDAQDGSVLQTLPDWDDGVAFSPDGRSIAAVKSHALCVFDVETGHCPAQSEPQEGADLRNAIYSRDGRWIAAIDHDGVRIFDATSAQFLRLVADPQRADGRIFDPRSTVFTVGGEPARLVRFWQEMLPEFRPAVVSDESMGYQKCAFSPYETCAAVIADVFDMTDPYRCQCVAILDAGSLNTLRLLEVPALEHIYSIAFSPDGRRLAAGGRLQEITVWDVSDGREVARIGRPPAPVVSVAASTTQSYWVAATKDGAIGLGRFDPPEVLRSGRYSTNDAAHVEFSPDGRRLVLACRDGMVLLLGVPELDTVAEFAAHRAKLVGAAFSPDSTQLVTVGYDDPPAREDREGQAVVRRWTLPDGRMLNEAELPAGRSINCVAVSSSRRHLALVRFHEVLIVDVHESLAVRPVLSMPKKQFIGRVAFGDGDFQLIVANEGHGMRVADLKAKRTVKAFASTRDGPTSFAFTRDFRSLIRTSAYFNEIELFEFGTRVLKKYFVGHQNSVSSVAVSPDDRWLISGGSDGTVKLWELGSGELVASILVRPDAASVSDWECLHCQSDANP